MMERQLGPHGAPHIDDLLDVLTRISQNKMELRAGNGVSFFGCRQQRQFKNPSLSD